MRALPLTLQTKVGRRIALLFVLSALLPIAVLAVLGYLQVRRQLVGQTQGQLAQAAKSVGMGLLDQLAGARASVERFAGPTAASGAADPAADRLRMVFSSFALQRGGTPAVQWGDAPPLGALPAQRAAAVDSGGSALIAVPGDSVTVWLVLPARDGRWWGALRHDYLFLGAGERSVIGGGQTNVCVRDADGGRTLFCAEPDEPESRRAAASWVVFLAYEYGAPPWRVEVTQPMAVSLAPVLSFRRTLAASLVAVLGLVVLLTAVQVRRSLDPLRALHEGTRRLADRDFSSTVRVESRDEFEDLADSFNTMAGELHHQFRTLGAVAAIDQAALASPRADEVAETAAAQLRATLDGEVVDVCLVGERPEDSWRRVRADASGVRAEGVVEMRRADAEALNGARGGWLLPDDSAAFAFLGGGAATGTVQVLPLFSGSELAGLVAVRRATRPGDAALRDARRLSDKVVLGLSNARLIVRLGQLSYGALAALARAVDASSPWTGGHSERVTACSLRIAERLALRDAQLDTLRRGGLLHDIGKIGIPPSITDKPGVLDEEEFGRMREHPALGAKILEPIAAFADAIPIVRGHHERFDGTGYPDGLAGEAIPFLARLLAVGDVYDALVSSRPYRPGWDQRAAIDAIRASSGSHFDPQMVEAFLAVMAEEGDAARFSYALESVL